MKSILISLSVCVFFWFTPRQGISSVAFLDMDLDDVREIAGEEGFLYFGYFTADWCAPCQWMNEHTFKDPELSRFVAFNYLAVKIDIDNWKSRVHQEQFQVKMLPSILVFNAQGQLLEKIESSISGPDLLKVLEKHNLPKNRLGSSPPSSPEKKTIMESPKPAIQVYRPPLQAEQPKVSAAKPTTSLPPPVVISNSPSGTRDEKIQAKPSSETFAPRSRPIYRIQVGVYDDYDQAIRQVGQLEAGFKEPVQIIGDKEENSLRKYHIYIGRFTQKKAAAEFLYYLRRKNIDGMIREMH